MGKQRERGMRKWGGQRKRGKRKKKKETRVRRNAEATKTKSQQSTNNHTTNNQPTTNNNSPSAENNSTRVAVGSAVPLAVGANSSRRDPRSAGSGSVNLTANVRPIALSAAGSVSVGAMVAVPLNATPVADAVAATLLIESWYDKTTS